jgi:hypothetical protein
MTVVGKRTRARKPAPSAKVDPPGIWREELQCGGCGSGEIRRITKRLPESSATFGPVCKSTFMGRPGNKCGWRTSRVWVWVPEQPL